MKAWRIYGFDDMRLDELPEPKVKPGWVKIQVLVVQPSITETLLYKGYQTYHYSTVTDALAKGPAQLFGHEFSARVVELGPGVTTLKVGDRVTTRALGPDGVVGFHYPGCLAEYAVVPENILVTVPDHVNDSEAAAIQPLTDATAGVHAAEIRLGDVVVIIGQGAMGLSCLQCARAAGAGLTVAIDVNPTVLAVARTLGADVTIDPRSEDPVATVKRLTGGIGADIVFETAGGPPDQGLAGTKTLNQAAEMAKDYGKIIGIALYGEATVLPYGVFRHRSLRYIFPSMLDTKLLRTTVDLVASGRVKLKPLITKVLSGIDKVPESFELTANKNAHGLINPAQVVIAN